MLADETSLRLAVLNSCEGARTSSDDPFAGTAASLVHREIPAVVAMQFEITDRAAVVFGGEFYAALADGYPVDSALAEARKAIFADQNDVEWGTPVLFMRVADGQIFDVAADPASEKKVPGDPARGAAATAADCRAGAAPSSRSPAPRYLCGPSQRLGQGGDDGARTAQRRRPLDRRGCPARDRRLLPLGFPGGRSWLDLKFGEDGIEARGIFTALSPVALVLGTLAALALAFRPRTRELAAGLLIGFGVAGAVKYLGLLGLVITDNATRWSSAVVFTGVVAGAVLVVVAGVLLAFMNARGRWSRPSR